MVIMQGPKWSWAEIVMGRNHGNSLDRNDPEPVESSRTGVPGRDGLCRNTIIVSIDMSSALRLRKFETQVRMVSSHFKSIFRHFYDPICLQK